MKPLITLKEAIGMFTAVVGIMLCYVTALVGICFGLLLVVIGANTDQGQTIAAGPVVMAASAVVGGVAVWLHGKLIAMA